MTSNDYLTGFAALGRLLDAGNDFAVLGPQLEARVAKNPADANAMLDIATLGFLTMNDANRPFALQYQQRALGLQQVYRLQPPASVALRLLVLMAPGDMTSNTPVDCLLEGSDVETTLLYALPNRKLPSPLPEHDVVFVAVGESSANQPLLRELADLASLTSKPIVNAPDRVAHLVRDDAARLLDGVPGTLIPAAARTARAMLDDVRRGRRQLGAVLRDGRFPILVRPIDSQGGKDLAKVDDLAELGAYIDRVAAAEFFVAQFVDYRSADGQFRKCRVAIVDGRPFACHMGVSSNWMIHYVNAGMHDSADKRADEARFFASFDDDFALRHRAALAVVHQRLGLDYVTLDCADAPDGRLLVFEVDNAALVHDFDDPRLFPYKPAAMRKVFDAFRTMLSERAHRAA